MGQSEAPERIWLDVKSESEVWAWEESCAFKDDVEYTRADQSGALVAAAYEDAADACAMETWRHEGDDAYSRGLDRGACHQASACAAAVRSRVRQDAAAKLAAMLAEAREEGRRSGIEQAADMTANRGQQMLSQEIRALLGQPDPLQEGIDAMTDERCKGDDDNG